MPVYNAQRYLDDAINSILSQTYGEFEFLIINDGSTDGSADLIRSYRDPRIKLVETENRGVAEALTLGVSLAKGAYIARMDADDVALPSRLCKQKQILDKNPDIVVAHSKVDYVDADGQIVKAGMGDQTTDQESRWLLVWRNVPFHSTTMMRASVLRKSGLNYRPKMNLAEDYDLWNRVALVGGFYFIPEVLLRYRIHEQAVTRGERAASQLEVQGRVTQENFKRYDISISEDDAKELAILAGSTQSDSGQYHYRHVPKMLIGLEKGLAWRFSVKHGIATTELSTVRSKQLLKWARAMLATSKMLALKLIGRACVVAPKMLMGWRVWVLLGASVMPIGLLELLVRRRRGYI